MNSGTDPFMNSAADQRQQRGNELQNASCIPSILRAHWLCWLTEAITLLNMFFILITMEASFQKRMFTPPRKQEWS